MSLPFVAAQGGHVTNCFRWVKAQSLAGTFLFSENSDERMNLVGKTREQIEAALANNSRAELLDLIHSLVTVEQLHKPSEIARRSCINKRAVLRDIRDGKFGPYYSRGDNSIAVPASGVEKWRRSFRVPGKFGKDGNSAVS